MKTLLEHRADVNATANRGQTALMLASWTGTWGLDTTHRQTSRIDAVRLLLESGADPNAADDAGVSALVGAAEVDHLGAARFLLNNGARINARTKSGRTALMESAREGNVEMLRLLLNAGADPQAKDNSSKTALSEAVSVYRRPEVVGVLLNSRANLQEKGSHNGVGMALQVAELLERYNSVNFFEQAGVALSDNEALILAARWGEMEKVQRLLAKGADANARGTRGRPVLTYATRRDDPDVVRLLIEKGASVNARDDVGETALMEASTEGSVEVARALVRSGADVNASSDAGTTALINAAWRGRLEVVLLLIQKGADLNARTRSGATALEKSQFCGANKEEIRRLLKQAGAAR